jgi:hypothetical protein
MNGLQLGLGILLGVLVLVGLRALVSEVLYKHGYPRKDEQIDSDNFGDR